MIMSRCIRLNEIMKVSWLFGADDFICKGGNLESNALFDGKPVELVKCWSNVISAFEVGKDKTSKRVLDALEALDR